MDGELSDIGGARKLPRRGRTFGFTRGTAEAQTTALRNEQNTTVSLSRAHAGELATTIGYGQHTTAFDVSRTLALALRSNDECDRTPHRQHGQRHFLLSASRQAAQR